MILAHPLLRWATLAWLGALALAGCGTPPPLRLHTLMPDRGPTAKAPGPPITVQLGTVVVPAQVDQPQWLVRLPDGTLALLENERWASPLRDELRAALRDTLARRWGVLDAAGPAPGVARWRINLELSRLDSTPAREAGLDAQWVIAPIAPAATAPAAIQPTVACGARLRQPVGASTVALADGHRLNVARLADRLGRQLRALDQGQQPGCDADD